MKHFAIYKNYFSQIHKFNIAFLILFSFFYVFFKAGISINGIENIGIHNLMLTLAYLVNVFLVYKYKYNPLIIFSSFILILLIFISIMVNIPLSNYKPLLLSLMLFQMMSVLNYNIAARLITFLLFVLLLTAVLSIFQYIFRYLLGLDIDLKILYPAYFFVGKTIPFYGSGFSTHPSTNAFLLIFGFGISIFKLLNTKHNIYLLISTIFFLGILSTLSRTALFSACFLIVYVLFINKKIFIKLSLSIFFAYALFLNANTYFNVTFGQKISIIGKNQDDVSSVSRKINIIHDYHMYKSLSLNNKFFGLKESYYAYKKDYLAKINNDLNTFEKYYILEQKTPHFIVFTILFKYGLIISASIVLFIGFVSYKIYHQKLPDGLYLLYLSYTMLIYCITHDLFDDRLYWLVLSLSVILSKQKYSNEIS